MENSKNAQNNSNTQQDLKQGSNFDQNRQQQGSKTSPQSGSNSGSQSSKTNENR